jgi:hypothetical protein
MKLFIPPLGTKLMLLAPWTFSLIYEARNRTLWDLMFAPPEMSRFPTRWKEDFCEARSVTLDPGLTLKVERIHIRRGATGYDSVTFRGHVHGPSRSGPLHTVRFWVSLGDANKMEVRETE